MESQKQHQQKTWQRSGRRKKEHFIEAHFHSVDSITWKHIYFRMKVKYFVFTHRMWFHRFDWNVCVWYTSVDRFNLMQIILGISRAIIALLWALIFLCASYFRFHSVHIVCVPVYWHASIVPFLFLGHCVAVQFQRKPVVISKKEKGISIAFRYTYTHTYSYRVHRIFLSNQFSRVIHQIFMDEMKLF